ncbi:MAG: hypothetical protein ACTSR1_12480 [Candidatus Heimdallarchaeota archaeon]
MGKSCKSPRYEFTNHARWNQIRFNKSDLNDAIAVDDETAHNIKQTFHMVDYIKTSSKSGTNVDVAFKSIIEFLITKSKY